MKTASTNLQKITTLSSEITASEGFKKIQTEEDLNKLKNTILNPETMLPCNLFNNKLQLLSIREFLEKQNKELSKGVGSNIDPFSKVKSDFEASVHIGDFYTEMYIKIGEKSYKTLCFLNKDGIVYNNILSYFIVIRSKEKNKNEITFNSKSAMLSTSVTSSVGVSPTSPPKFATTPFTYLFNIEAGWFWQSDTYTRGGASAAYSTKMASYNGKNYLVAKNETHSAYMNLGTANCEAQCFYIGQTIIPVPGYPSIYAYSAIGVSAAYGLSTGFINFNISLSYGSANVTVAGSLGSQVHGGATVL